MIQMTKSSYIQNFALALSAVSLALAALPLSAKDIAPAASPAEQASPSGQTAMDRSTLMSLGEREPYEVRVFNLKYAFAEDRKVRTLRGETVIEGVATTLQKISGIQTKQSERSHVAKDIDGAIDGPRIMASGLKKVVIKDRPEAMKAYAAIIDAVDVAKQIIEFDIMVVEYDADYGKKIAGKTTSTTPSFAALFGEMPETNAKNQKPSILDTKSLSANITKLEKQGWVRVLFKVKTVGLDDIPLSFSSQDIKRQKITLDPKAKPFPVEAIQGIDITPNIVMENNQAKIRMKILIEDGKFDNGARVATVIANISTLQPGETLIMGGMNTANQGSKAKKVTGPENIPAIGEEFKKRKKSNSKIEKIYIITPRLVTVDADKETAAK
jgi:hypothetical protein